MRRFCLLGVWLTILAPRTSFADLLATNELIATVESSIVDFDVSMIGVHNTYGSGSSSSGSLSYSSTISDSGWQGRLLGTYMGVSVDISYTGTITFIGGPTNQYDISYTSSWLLDGQTGSGAGSGTYTDPEFDFEIDLVNLSVSGSVSVSYGAVSLTLTGTKDLDDQTLEVSGEVAIGDLPLIDASLASASITFSLNQVTGEYESTLEASFLDLITVLDETINEGTLGGNANNTTITTTATVVPEPSSLAVALAAASLAGWTRLRKRANSRARSGRKASRS